MRRFIAMHKTEAGYSSTYEVENYIAKMGFPEDWRIVEIHVDETTEQIANLEIKQALERAYINGKEAQKQQIRDILGL